MGQSGNTIVDTDQANFMEVMLTTPPQVIPCKNCQQHAVAYCSGNPPPPLRGLYGQTLRETVRNWLFAFHNHVRSQNGQPIQMYTIRTMPTVGFLNRNILYLFKVWRPRFDKDGYAWNNGVNGTVIQSASEYYVEMLSYKESSSYHNRMVKHYALDSTGASGWSAGASGAGGWSAGATAACVGVVASEGKGARAQQQ